MDSWAAAAPSAATLSWLAATSWLAGTPCDVVGCGDLMVVGTPAPSWAPPAVRAAAASAAPRHTRPKVFGDVALEERSAEALAVRRAYAWPFLRVAERALAGPGLKLALEAMATEAVREEFGGCLFDGLGRAVDDGSLRAALETLVYDAHVEELGFEGRLDFLIHQLVSPLPLLCFVIICLSLSLSRVVSLPIVLCIS